VTKPFGSLTPVAATAAEGTAAGARVGSQGAVSRTCSYL